MFGWVNRNVLLKQRNQERLAFNWQTAGGREVVIKWRWTKYRLDVCPLLIPINSQKIAFAPFPAVFRRLILNLTVGDCHSGCNLPTST